MNPYAFIWLLTFLITTKYVIYSSATTYYKSYRFNLNEDEEWFMNDYENENENDNEIISCTIHIPSLCIHINTIPTMATFDVIYKDLKFDFLNDANWSKIILPNNLINDQQLQPQRRRLRHSNYRYKGCYKDTGRRALRRGPHSWHYSIDKCYRTCHHRGYRYFALQAGSWCSCENSWRHATKYGRGGGCRHRKGGGWRNSIFQIKRTRNLPYRWKGCYKDTGKRALRHGPHKYHYSIDKCYSTCKRKGYRYFALQAGSWCSCENSWRHATKYGRGGGCSREHKGGGWRNDIFQIKQAKRRSTNYKHYRYKGCYKDTGRRALRRGPHSWHYSIDKCYRTCHRSGYRYFALQAGSWCSCENSWRHAAKYGRSGGCKNRKGGGWRNSIFQIKRPRNMPYQWKGCYKDTGKRALRHGPHKYHYSIDRCYSTCKRKGYHYFALQAGSWCSCENSWRHATKYGRGGGCSRRHKGGGWRNDIFQIKHWRARRRKSRPRKRRRSRPRRRARKRRGRRNSRLAGRYYKKLYKVGKKIGKILSKSNRQRNCRRGGCGQNVGPVFPNTGGFIVGYGAPAGYGGGVSQSFMSGMSGGRRLLDMDGRGAVVGEIKLTKCVFIGSRHTEICATYYYIDGEHGYGWIELEYIVMAEEDMESVVDVYDNGLAEYIEENVWLCLWNEGGFVNDMQLQCDDAILSGIGYTVCIGDDMNVLIMENMADKNGSLVRKMNLMDDTEWDKVYNYEVDGGDDKKMCESVEMIEICVEMTANHQKMQVVSQRVLAQGPLPKNENIVEA